MMDAYESIGDLAAPIIFAVVVLVLLGVMLWRRIRP